MSTLTRVLKSNAVVMRLAARSSTSRASEYRNMKKALCTDRVCPPPPPLPRARWCPRLTSARPPHTAHPGEPPPRACPRRPALPGATLRRRARTGRLAGDGLPARLEGLCGLGALGLLVGLGAGLAL